jgi:hypothetical protein
MVHSNGIIVILSYPDTFVRPAVWEFSSRFWPYLGIGHKNAVQAGHAALLLIKKKDLEINYFDFGRYITTYKNGRVRSKETDVEVSIPIRAKFENNSLTNLDEILVWLESHPEITHGDGRLIASMNESIDYQKAYDFIHQCILQKEIPYGAFNKKGSNCARFVTDTLRKSTTQRKIKTALKTSKLLTPSPIGNVIKGKTISKIYEVHKGVIKEYHNRSILKEYKQCFFNKLNTEISIIGTEIPNKELFFPENATWLGGIGSGAWFQIKGKEHLDTYKIARYTASGQKDFEGTFKFVEEGFDATQKYQFVHPTNCVEAFILQNGKNFRLKKSEF